MSKFKIGDRVEVVTSILGIEVDSYHGRRGVVVNPHDGTDLIPVEVKLDGDGDDNNAWFAEQELRLEGDSPRWPTAPMTRSILGHLIKVRSISGNEADSLYKCKALPRRIADLKELGWEITRQFKVDATGQRYVRYELVSA